MSISGVSSGFGLIPDADPAGYQYGYTDPVAQTGEAVAADTPEARQFPAAPGLLRFTAGNFSYSFQAYRGQKYRIGLNAFDLATGAALTLTYGPTPPNYADAPYDFTYQNFNLNGQNWWYSDYSREDYNYPGHEAGTQNIAAASLDFFA